MPRWVPPTTAKEFKKWVRYLDRARAGAQFTPDDLQKVAESKDLSRFLREHTSNTQWGALRDAAHVGKIDLEANLNPRLRVENSRAQGGANAHEFGNPPALRPSGRSPRQLAGIPQKPSRNFYSPGNPVGPTFTRGEPTQAERELLEELGAVESTEGPGFYHTPGRARGTRKYRPGRKGPRGIFGLPLVGQEELRQLDAERRAVGEEAYPPNAATRALGVDPRKLRDLLVSYGAGTLELPQTLHRAVQAFQENRPDSRQRRFAPDAPIVDALARLGGGLAEPARGRLETSLSPVDEFVAGLLIPGRLPKVAPRTRVPNEPINIFRERSGGRDFQRQHEAFNHMANELDEQDWRKLLRSLAQQGARQGDQ